MPNNSYISGNPERFAYQNEPLTILGVIQSAQNILWQIDSGNTPKEILPLQSLQNITIFLLRMHRFQKSLQVPSANRINIFLHEKGSMEDKDTIWEFDSVTFSCKGESFSVPLQVISTDEEGQRILKVYFLLGT